MSFFNEEKLNEERLELRKYLKSRRLEVGAVNFLLSDMLRQLAAETAADLIDTEAP